MTRDEIQALEKPAFDKVMDILRALPWQARENVCASLRYNAEFCWACGMDMPKGGTCHCTNDE